MLENLTALVIKIGLFLITFIIMIRCFIIIPVIWIKYDHPIIKLKKDLANFKEKTKDEPIAKPFIEGKIQQQELVINEKLDLIETKRKLFLDRVNLFLSISSINR